MPSRSTLRGGRGWSTVAGLGTVLVVLAAGQLPAASADAAGGGAAGVAAGVAAGSAVGSAAAPRTVTTSAADRLPGTFLPTALPPAVPSAPAAPATPAAEPAAAAPAAPAPAAPDVCSGAGWQERRGRAALATLKGGAERTGFRLEFKPARTGYLGLTHLQERRIEVFVRPCDTQSDELLRHVMAHELGHAYDTAHGSAATRKAWQSVRGIPATTPWYGCSGCTDFATPAGDFAEVYAQWARGSSTNRSELAGDVPAGQLAALAQQFFGA